ncbi:hypothetical protein AWH56_005155 [Anaerobacillus isosaccharinicus]|uniref:Uncharacterized protein n=1 Tax=Anaerobacillus isosaccharinicus TaxID=1532552 RepID=A0A1S2LB92_9BACI|nr:hypothetical protein [Anaerobacillus isosaccharinicus]MBA5584586.1 hypothetical protein [Anaerobacillus isosaccharinicus]QOY37034.1 hypothetical protein AWH56_005155 [Anaerobacillus isosaccharinicus]
MTSIKDVEKELAKLVVVHKLAEEWLQNDIIKMKIAMSYDDWNYDHANQPEMIIELDGHVEYCLIHPELVGAK